MLQTQLTGEVKDKIKKMCLYMTEAEMEAKAIECFEGGFPAMGQYVQYLIAQRPGHRCVGDFDAPQDRPKAQPRQDTPAGPWLTPQRQIELLIAGGWIFGVIIASGVVGLVFFPMLGALGASGSSVMMEYGGAILVGFLVIGGTIVFAISAIKSALKKNDSPPYQGEPPPGQGWFYQKQEQGFWYKA